VTVAAAAYAERVLDAVIALIPSAGVLFLFVLAVRAMLEGDRRERAAQARWDLDHPQDEQAHKSL
jgi:hypothetical protein